MVCSLRKAQGGCLKHTGYRVASILDNKRGILLITPHQLSSDAMRLIRQGVNDFVKGLPDRNYYAGSTQISHEVDAEIFIHIEKINGVSWLTCQRGKYRSPKVVDDKDKYIALPFNPEYGLQDDLLREELGRKSPGATVNSQGVEEAPFWEIM